MEFWGVEVEAGKSLKVKPDFDTLIHVSQASLDKGKKGETALLYVTVDGKKLVMGTLSRETIPQTSFDLVFEKEFELSHSLESGSVHFVGYKSPNMDAEEEDDFSDSEEEEEAAAVPATTVTANGGSNVVKADSKPKASAKPVEVKVESDEDDDESDEEGDDSEEDGSDSEIGMDVDSDDEEEDDSEDEETPKKPEVSNKKRPNESASKTPLSSKKAKPAEEKKGGHTATPHPAKKGGGKNPMNANNQSPKSGGQSSNKKQFNSGKQFGSNNKGKGRGKGRA